VTRDEQREKVARAMHDAFYDNHPERWDLIDDAGRGLWRGLADAAIEAMGAGFVTRELFEDVLYLMDNAGNTTTGYAVTATAVADALAGVAVIDSGEAGK
jgi:hypothetical protein